MNIDLLYDIITYNHHMSSVYCRGGNKLVFDVTIYDDNQFICHC